jgi:GrpB-like predicted nucleotidyltransferase (UPF0157 family)
MTLEELWQLFPISLTAPQQQWTAEYQQEANRVRKILQDFAVVRISHIGSTAIKGIWAKAIVDILVEVAPETKLADVAKQLTQNGYTIMSEEETRLSLNKGYTVRGFADEVYHLHLRFSGDNKESYFRDYLNEHPTIAKKYEALKIKLWHQFAHDRDGYTNLKGTLFKNIPTWLRQNIQVGMANNVICRTCDYSCNWELPQLFQNHLMQHPHSDLRRGHMAQLAFNKELYLGIAAGPEYFGGSVQIIGGSPELNFVLVRI